MEEGVSKVSEAVAVITGETSYDITRFGIFKPPEGNLILLCVMLLCCAFCLAYVLCKYWRENTPSVEPGPVRIVGGGGRGKTHLKSHHETAKPDPNTFLCIVAMSVATAVSLVIVVYDAYRIYVLGSNLPFFKTKIGMVVGCSVCPAIVLALILGIVFGVWAPEHTPIDVSAVKVLVLVDNRVIVVAIAASLALVTAIVLNT
ncbi:uncharacterized protein BXIN_2504 [Babesia sp. Xinjiang]|uniref:uncharacterized protein n=1 Tax=Babesia sp. Xinjiang TaxID=462227 RepID=UPI000A25A128|nr:uncharacterized protein BXIN_2504 [Babesia sp. Xinjiang]ORM41427.1 hypothetical protein BXIN_2504 [Babesia sp. Xinjiang]